MEDVGTPPHQLERVFHAVLVEPSQVPVAVILISFVFPEVAVVGQLFSVSELMVTVVVPAAVRLGVVNVPLLLPPVTLIKTSAALWALLPVRV